MVKVHWLLAIFLALGILVAVVRDSVLLELDLGSIYWALVGIVGLGAFLRLSWFGVDIRAGIMGRLPSPVAAVLARLSRTRTGHVQSAA